MTTDQVYVVVEMFDGVLDNLEVYTNDPDPHELYPATCDEFWNKGKKVFVTPCITRTKNEYKTNL